MQIQMQKKCKYKCKYRCKYNFFLGNSSSKLFNVVVLWLVTCTQFLDIEYKYKYRYEYDYKCKKSFGKQQKQIIQCGRALVTYLHTNSPMSNTNINTNKNTDANAYANKKLYKATVAMVELFNVVVLWLLIRTQTPRYQIQIQIQIQM